MKLRISEIVAVNPLWGEVYGIFLQQLSYAKNPALGLANFAFDAYELQVYRIAPQLNECYPTAVHSFLVACSPGSFPNAQA